MTFPGEKGKAATSTASSTKRMVFSAFLATALVGTTAAFSAGPSATTFAVAAAWRQRSSHRRGLLSTAADKEEEETLFREDLPDYGTTSVEIDQITLETKQRPWRRKDLYGTTLVDQTMKELETDVEFQETAKKLQERGAQQMSKEERTKRRRALDSLGVPDFNVFLHQKLNNSNNDNDKESLELVRQAPEVLQINIGLYCNQACAHCHVESSPMRTEMMTAKVAAQCLKLLENTPSITTLDITGGAPELNDNFRYLVTMARQVRPDIDIIDRCNLTVLQEPGQEDLIDFLKKHRVHIIASLPCYSADNVDTQRGNGVFERSISALLALNEAGYGVDNGRLELDLVYNPLGAFLPPPQQDLQTKYKEVLAENFGILFDHLFTMTNMPVKRFTDFLYRRGELKDYMDLLVRNFNADTTKSLMCLNTISVGYDGKIFDCDFNQQLGYGIGADDKIHQDGITVFDLNSLDDLASYGIRNDNHCFGCTAGMGSS